MTDHYTLARRAEYELSATQAAYEQTRAQLVTDLLATDPADTMSRESLYHQIKGLDAIRDRLKHFISIDAFEAAARGLEEE